MKLVLFDIDGTILLTNGSGRRSMEHALGRVLSRPITTSGVSFAGRTDRRILRDILAVNGLDVPDGRETLTEMESAYQDEMRRTLIPEAVIVLPGVPTLLDALACRSDVQLALLTGNLEPTAYLKLQAVGLDGYFPFGAFGSDDEDRNNLPAVALSRAAAHTGRRFDSDCVYIVGDTEHDVTCSRAIGCRTVIVCTGTYSREQLAVHEPDLLLDDLSDTYSVIKFICPDRS